MTLFFRPVHKAQKDRTILKRIDQTLSRQGLPSAVSHFAIFILIESYLLQKGETPTGVYIAGLALVIMAAWRFIMIAQFESWYAKGPTRWRDAFILSGFFHSGIWSGYVLYRLSMVPDETIMLLALLYTAAIAASGTFVYSLYGKTIRVYLLILLCPIAFYFFFIGQSPADIIIGFGFVGMYFYLSSMAFRIADLIWNFLTTNHELKIRLSTLEQASDANTVENSSNRRFIQQVLQSLKSPLSGLLGVLGTINVGEKDTENHGMLNIARRSGYSILELMTDLEAFIEQRDRTRVPQSMVFNLRKTLEHALADMGAKAHETGRELSYLYHPDVPERIEADPKWLSNAFRRLIDFTIDAADAGEITVRIAMSSHSGQEFLQLIFYFMNSEIDASDLTSALERPLDMLPDDDDVADQLTLLVAAGQFKSMDANLTATQKGDLKRITVELPINSSTQQASSFRPAKYMSGKSILLVDLSPLNERSLTAEFMSWNMSVAVWTLDRLCEEKGAIDSDFVLINVPVDDQQAREQLDYLRLLTKRLSQHTHVILYASELQHNLFMDISANFTFVEKPVARDQLLSALRDATEMRSEVALEAYRCEQTKILLVENNLLSQKVFLKTLEPTGLEVETCVSGQQAIELIGKVDYDMVFMDTYMPKMDGLEATRIIRKNESDTGKHVPIVALTSEVSPELERECLAAGMDDFLVKPLQYDDVIESIQRWS